MHLLFLDTKLHAYINSFFNNRQGNTRRVTDIYLSSAPFYAQDKRFRASLEDESRSERPLNTTDEEMCNKVRTLVFSDRRIWVEEISHHAFHIVTNLQSYMTI